MSLRLAEFPHYRLTNCPDYRFRVGDYRIIYNFDLEKNIIYLLGVGNRKEIYRK